MSIVYIVGELEADFPDSQRHYFAGVTNKSCEFTDLWGGDLPQDQWTDNIDHAYWMTKEQADAVLAEFERRAEHCERITGYKPPFAIFGYDTANAPAHLW